MDKIIKNIEQGIKSGIKQAHAIQTLEERFEEALGSVKDPDCLTPEKLAEIAREYEREVDLIKVDNINNN